MRNASKGKDMDFEGKCHNCDRKFHPRERKRKWCGSKCRNEFTRKIHFLVSRRLMEREAV